MDGIKSNLILSQATRYLGYIGFLFLSLNPESYGILGLLMVVDTITGVMRSGLLHGWRTVTSHAASVGILSKCLLILVPLLIAIGGRGVGLDLTFVAGGTLKILIVSELYSILSNIQSIRIGKEVAEFDAVNYTLSKIREFLEAWVKKTDIK